MVSRSNAPEVPVIPGFQPLQQSVNAQTGTSYNAVKADFGKLVTLNNSGAIAVVLPNEATVPAEIGSYIDFLTLGTGQVTWSVGSGATLLISGLTAKSRAQYSRIGAQKVATNTWSLFGDLAAS